MSEYGYILVKGLYNVSEDKLTGLDYLFTAVSDKEPLAGAYLADIYKSGDYHGTEYEDLSYENWFTAISLGLKLYDGMSSIVIGVFLENGIGGKRDETKAIEHYSYTAKNQLPPWLRR